MNIIKIIKLGLIANVILVVCAFDGVVLWSIIRWLS